jgi:hypothetical protein
MFIKVGLFFGLIIGSIFACQSSQDSTVAPPGMGNQHPAKPPKQEISQARLNLDQTPLTSDRNKVLMGTVLSDLYSGQGHWIPKCTTLWDYPASAQFGPDIFHALVIKLPTPTVQDQLPEKIKELLKIQGVENLDVFFHAQRAGGLGESEDHTDGSPKTTRLRPHGWADPDVPNAFVGDRVNRNFLVGIFDLDHPEMEDEVKVDTLLPFNLHTHDSLASPRNMRIKLVNDSSSSFWSLVIDHENPAGTKRAVATLHWLMGSNRVLSHDDLFEIIEVPDPNGGTGIGDEEVGIEDLGISITYKLKYKTWGELFGFLKTKKETASLPIIKKLNTLLPQ